MEISRESGEPPYQQIAAQLRAQIIAGEITSRLPSAVSLSQEHGVAIMTSRKALRLLVSEGYARTVTGMGTYITPREEWPAG